MDKKHVNLGGRDNDLNIIDHCKMSIGEIEEFNIKKGQMGWSTSERLQDHSDLGYKITFTKGISEDSK